MINTNYHSIGLIIWRSLVSSLRSEGLPLVNKSQAQAGPRFYYSDLRFGVGRCFWFLGISFVMPSFILIVIIPISPNQHPFAVKLHYFVLHVCRSRTHKKRPILHSNDYPLHNQTACGRNTCCTSYCLSSSNSM